MDNSFFDMDDYPDARKVFSHLPQLETPRLILRPMKYRDAQDIYQFSKDPQVARFVLWSAHESVWDSIRYIRYLKQLSNAGDPTSFAIQLKATGKVVGTIGFMAYSEEHSTVEVGYSLARWLWNQGIMTEALRCFLDLCFNRMHIHRVEAMYDVRNASSGRVMEKCGMHHEGILRGKVFNKGEFADVNMCAILREDWEKMVTSAD